MFKCKIDIAEFDKNNSSKPDVDIKKAKNLSKAGVKKLAGKPEVKTDFFLAKDYFENKGKAIGSFFALGTSKKLTKQFVTKEMKGVKGAVSTDKKAVSTGEAYVKLVDGKYVLHIIPHDASKVPAGQWPKILKSLKAFFAGLKAVVLIGGELIEEEPGGEVDADDAAGFTPDTSVDPDDSVEEADDEAETEEVDVTAMKAEIKELIAAVKAFVATEMAAVKTDKSAKSILAAWKKGSEIAAQFAEWLQKAATNAGLQAEIAAAKTANTSVATILNQLKPTIDKIEAKQGEKESNASLDGITVDIAGKIADILKNFTGDINAIPGLKDIMNTIK